MSRFRLAVFGLFLAAAAAAQPARLVMVTEVWPPYRMDDPASASGFSGIDVDLMAALEARLGLPIEIKRVPWARALEMMRAGQADLITGIAWTAERATYMTYVPTSYSSVRPMFYAPRGKGAAVKSYDDLYGKGIGMSTHSSYFPRFDADGALDKIPLSTEEQILQMLSLGRLGLAVGTDPNLGWDIARLGLRELVEPTAWQPEERTPLYLALSMKSPAAALAGRIDAAVKAMLADGTIERILAKYR